MHLNTVRIIIMQCRNNKMKQTGKKYPEIPVYWAGNMYIGCISKVEHASRMLQTCSKTRLKWLQFSIQKKVMYVQLFQCIHFWSWLITLLCEGFLSKLGVHQQNLRSGPCVKVFVYNSPLLWHFSCRIPNISALEVVCKRNDLLSHLIDHPGDWTPVVTDWLLHLVMRGLGKRVEMLCFKPQTPFQVN